MDHLYAEEREVTIGYARGVMVLERVSPSEAPVRKNTIDLGHIEDLQILAPDGQADEAFAPRLDDEGTAGALKRIGNHGRRKNRPPSSW